MPLTPALPLTQSRRQARGEQPERTDETMAKTVHTTEINDCAVRVYLSTGSDGYTAGTYGYIVDLEQYDGLHTWTDGGYESSERALDKAVRIARKAG
jgi:hypothetical protein